MNKDIIIFVNAIRPATFTALQILKTQTGKLFTPIVLVDRKIQALITERNGQNYNERDVIILSADFDSALSIKAALMPFMDRIFAVTSQYENSVNELKKLIPHLPYLPMPSEQSLEWATEKKLMRQLMEAYDGTLVPKYLEVTDSLEKTITKICSTMTFPLIVKPSGLEGSLLVSLARNRAELRQNLSDTFHGIQEAYDKWIKRQKPAVLVEEFMEGEMYSVDSYISADGSFVHTPPVRVITGREAGYDDFFGYIQKSPSGLSDQETKNAYDAVERACRAVCLRSVTAHVELMRTRDSWKIIELGPRVGGFRHEIYSKSYGINHIANDALNRGGEAPIIPGKTLAYTAFVNMYAREEGILKSVSGIEEVKRMKSVHSVMQCTLIGEEHLFAKNNGDPVFKIVVSNKTERGLNRDIQIIEKTLKFEITTPVQTTLQAALMQQVLTA